jgi:hypothetical protein
MIGALVVLMAVLSAATLAVSARFDTLVSTLLCGYLALVGSTVGVALLLSPARLVTQDGLLVAEAVLLAASAGLWWRRGRPRPPLRGARDAFAAVLGRPETAVFFLAFLVLVGYELLLGLGVPPNNWDSLTYHLSRAAAWTQHHGYFWIPNAPTDRMNEFQPLAEQENLFLFAATRSDALWVLPQFVAALAAFVAVYGSARRLGYEVRAAACATFLVATFGLVALEASTAQNDLVAASFPAIAACLLLGTGNLEAILAGASAALGLGAKLTTVLVLPVLVVLALTRGRRATLLAVAGGVAGFVAIAMWGFVLNEVHTGHLLGHGGGRVENTQSPSWPASALTGLYLLYATMDMSTVPQRLYNAATAAGIVALALAGAFAFRRERGRSLAAALPAVPLLAPIATIIAGGAIAYLARDWGYPVRGPGGIIGGLNRVSNEDDSAFGPLGAVALLGVPVVFLAAFLRRKADARKLALAATFPLFLVLLCLQAKWNEFLPRFLVVPVLLVAPLLATFITRRAATVAFFVTASIIAGYTVTNVQARPLDTPFGHPWTLDQVEAVYQAQDEAASRALRRFDEIVPPNACVGAVLGLDEPAYVLYGRTFRHKVDYLAVADAVHEALADGLFYVVISDGPNRAVSSSFRAAGWKLRPLADYWLLASEPHAGSGTCG